MGSRLFLVRHAPTHAKVMIGWSDIAADLSDQDTIARLDAALPKDAPILTSDLRRAVDTADALSKRPRLPANAQLREIHFGRWEGLHFTQAEAEDPSLIRSFWGTPGTIAAPDGESWNDLVARVGRTLDTLSGEVIIICHFGAILAALQHLTGLSALEVLSHKIEPLSVTVLEQDAGGWRINQINHLP